MHKMQTSGRCMLSKNKKNTGAIDSGMCNSEQHGHGLVRVIWTHLCSGSAATNTFLFCAKECATNSSCGRLALARGGGAWKQINVTTFLRCGLGENSSVLQQHLSSGDGSCSDAMTPQWPSAVSAYCSFKTLSVCCRYCVHVWLRCVSKCVHMYLKQQLMQFLHLVVYDCQTSFLFFLTSCRYDICIQKNKPCETLGNLPSHVTTNFHISDPADSFS